MQVGMHVGFVVLLHSVLESSFGVSAFRVGWNPTRSNYYSYLQAKRPNQIDFTKQEISCSHGSS